MMYGANPPGITEGCSAALYIRLSKEDAEKEGKNNPAGVYGGTGESESVANQRSLLREFTDKHKIYVYDEYVDDGWSGGNYDRPAFKRLLADMERKAVNMVITKDMSRLGRDYIETGNYLERYFPEHNIRYISLLDGIDTGMDLSANEITPFRAIINDLYAKDISKKIKSVKHDKQRKGLFIGWKAPYGYKASASGSNYLAVDEPAAKVVREIFDMALSGLSCRQIASDLNDAHIPPPSVYAGLKPGRKGPYAGLWSSERVTDTLKNRVYAGDMVQHRVIKVSYKSGKCRRLPEDKWVIAENTHEPIISRDNFERAGRLIRSRKTTRTRTYDYLLKGMIFCSECGQKLAVMNRVLAANNPVLYFVCRTYQRFTKGGACTCHASRVSAVTFAVAERVRNICRTVLSLTEVALTAKSVEGEAAGENETSAEIKRLTDEICALNAKTDKLYEDRLNGVIDDADFKRLYAGIKPAETNKKERLRVLNSIAEINPEFDEPANELFEKFLASVENNKDLICSLVDRVELTEDKKVIIRYRFQPEEIIRLQ